MSATLADVKVNESTQKAKTETLLSPRFYRTDIDGMGRIDLDPVRKEWTELMAEFHADSNREHFKPDGNYDSEVRELTPELRKEFLDFLVSSVTAEYSGQVLYSDIADKVDNKDIEEVMRLMARDETRHAGFINRALHGFDLPVHLGFLRQAKKYTFFRPKFIFYATYLSEKIGYARYITIFRQLERHPELRFHPIFRWFERWCRDEFRHGEVFALLMKANPHLLRGHNKLWIRFFLLAVFSTMYVRDHTRPELHEAMGFDPTEYDMQVLGITSEITKQIFPFTLNLGDSRFQAGLERMAEIGRASAAARARGGLIGNLRRAGLSIKGALTFARLYLLPVVSNKAPENVRLAPSW